MSIQDIIEAAITRQEKVSDHLHLAYSMNTTLDYLYQIREEVALMEAERVAAREFITQRVNEFEFEVRKYNEWMGACEATDRYRKERGL